MVKHNSLSLRDEEKFDKNNNNGNYPQY